MDRRQSSVSFSLSAVFDGQDGENSVRIDLDNMADIVSLDGEGKVRFTQTIVVKARIYDGAKIPTAGVTKGSGMTAADLKIGGCTPTVSGVSAGVVTITWAFEKGLTGVVPTTKPIRLVYGGVTYDAVFTLSTTSANAVYQILPTLSEISFHKDSENVLKPDSVTLSCRYTKNVGEGAYSVTPSGRQIPDTTLYLYYRANTASGWGAWQNYAGSGITVSSSTDITDYEFCIADTSAAGNVGENTIIDREVVPVLKDGLNGANGKDGKDGNDGEDGIDGKDGRKANYEDRQYANYDSSATDSSGEPSGNRQSAWDSKIPARSTDYPYLWLRVRQHTFSDTNAETISGWSYGLLSSPGATGATGKMCYIAGEYRDDIEYTSNDTQTVAVEITGSGDKVEVYLLKAETNVVDGVHYPPIDSNGNLNSTYWEKGSSEYNLIRTKYLFADFANLGSFIVTGDWAFSQSGYIGNQAYDAGGQYGGKAAHLCFEPFSPFGPRRLAIFNSDVTSTSITRTSTFFSVGCSTLNIWVTGTKTGGNMYLSVYGGNGTRCKLYDSGSLKDEVELTDAGDRNLVVPGVSASKMYYVVARMSSSSYSGTITSITEYPFVPNFAVDGMTGRTYQRGASIASAGGNTSVEIADGQVRFLGSNGIANIILGIDDAGCAVLKFYDSDGNFRYDLGPDGIINAVEEHQERWVPIILGAVSLEDGLSTQYKQDIISEISNATTSTNYKWEQGYKVVGNVKTYKDGSNYSTTPSPYNLKTFISQSRSDSNLVAVGFYVGDEFQVPSLAEQTVTIYSRILYQVATAEDKSSGMPIIVGRYYYTGHGNSAVITDRYGSPLVTINKTMGELINGGEGI